MRIALFFLALNLSLAAFAQKQSYDIMSFSIPAKWMKETKDSYISFVNTHVPSSSWVRLSLYKSVTSAGSPEKDFQEDWKDLVMKYYAIPAKTAPDSSYTRKGWQYRVGTGTFSFNNADATVMLITITGYSTRVTVMALFNTGYFKKDIQSTIASIELKQPAETQPLKHTDVQPPTASVSSGFSFSTTNFDDGWVAVAKEDWVEVTRKDMKVLLHYPKEGTMTAADPAPFINNAWNILVAPRYRDLQHYSSGKSIVEQFRGYIGGGDVTEKSTGKQLYVVLFQRAKTGFIEIICPNRQAFIREFGFNIDDINWDWDTKIWDPLMQLQNYNRFAVAASDLTGKWTNDFNGALDMYSIYTGFYMGMTVSQSSTDFTFGPGSAYSWKLLTVNGPAGAMSYGQGKSSGKFSMPNNWQIDFSKIDDRARSYAVYFSCIKGGRILWMHDNSYNDGYTPFARAK